MTLIASLSKAVGFGIFAKVVQIMASQIAEFFCGVINKVIVERGPRYGMLIKLRSRSIPPIIRESQTPQYILIGFAGTTAFPVLPPNPAAPLHHLLTR